MLLRVLLVVACILQSHCSLGWWLGGSRRPLSWICRGPSSVDIFRRCESYWLGWRSVCHNEMPEEFRCYNLSDPYTNSEGRLPESPTQQKIQFKLFTRNNSATPDMLGAQDQGSVSGSHFIRGGKVAFIIHGFTDNSNESWVSILVKELLVKLPNVIVVDWSVGARGPYIRYPQATANTRVVGAHIATLIKTIHASIGLDYSKFYLIGHSLGAQIAGYAGEKFTTDKIGRITGLDPAGPNFENYDVRVKLDPSDAAFVDVIHTSIHDLTQGGLGTSKDCGHVDFWPNGGKDMDGCPKTSTSVLNVIHNFKAGSCNHAKAREYYAESVNNYTFPAYKCKGSNSFERDPTAWYRNYMGYPAQSFAWSLGRYCLDVASRY